MSFSMGKNVLISIGALTLVIMLSMPILVACGNNKATETKDIIFVTPDGLTAIAVSKLIANLIIY